MSGKTIIKRMLACAPALMLLASASCTYNYFEGTINYRVFVPEVRDHIVNNCHVLIYDRATGALTAQGYTRGGQSTTDQSKIAEGIFEFRLDKGDYKVCVLANTDSVDFNPDPVHEQAAFQLMSHPQPPFTKGPGDLRLDYIDRPHDGATEITDTAAIFRYPARIDVRYRATDVDADLVEKAIVRINNVASVQHLAADTVPEAVADGHALYFFHSPTKYPVDADGAIFQFTTYLFPTAPESVLDLVLHLSDSNGNSLANYTHGLRLPDASPLVLTPGDRAIIDINNNGITVSLRGWDSTIGGSESDLGGGKKSNS